MVLRSEFPAVMQRLVAMKAPKVTRECVEKRCAAQMIYHSASVMELTDLGPFKKPLPHSSRTIKDSVTISPLSV